MGSNPTPRTIDGETFVFQKWQNAFEKVLEKKKRAGLLEMMPPSVNESDYCRSCGKERKHYQWLKFRDSSALNHLEVPPHPCTMVEAIVPVCSWDGGRNELETSHTGEVT